MSKKKRLSCHELTDGIDYLKMRSRRAYNYFIETYEMDATATYLIENAMYALTDGKMTSKEFLGWMNRYYEASLDPSMDKENYFSELDFNFKKMDFVELSSLCIRLAESCLNAANEKHPAPKKMKASPTRRDLERHFNHTRMVYAETIYQFSERLATKSLHQDILFSVAGQFSAGEIELGDFRSWVNEWRKSNGETITPEEARDWRAKLGFSDLADSKNKLILEHQSQMAESLSNLEQHLEAKDNAYYRFLKSA